MCFGRSQYWRGSRESIGDCKEWRWEKRAGCVLQCVKPRKTASPERYRHPLRSRDRVETDFGTELGKVSASTGIADSVAHELSHPAVAAPAGRTPIRRI